MTDIAVMQPTFLPWLGYLDLVDRVDTFVLLDDVQFVRRSWQHRNRVAGDPEPRWLSVPVRSTGRDETTIESAELSEPSIADRHEGILRSAYRDAPAWDARSSTLLELIREGTGRDRLGDCNATILDGLASEVGIETPMVRSSSLGRRSTDRVQHLVDLVAALDGVRYVSVTGSADYLLPERSRFADAGIDVAFHDYEHPVYDQGDRAFTSHLSVVDALLQVTDDVGDLIRSGRRALRRADELASVSP
ncbi:MAG: WbqC family protein [Actinomycetota bacterium]